MAIPGISLDLSNDSLGLGQMFAGTASAITSATGTQLCGSKPTCIAWTKTCKEKNRVYNECRMKSLDVMSQQSRDTRSATVSEDEAAAQAAKSKRTLYIILAIVALIILLLIFKRRQS